LRQKPGLKTEVSRAFEAAADHINGAFRGEMEGSVRFGGFGFRKFTKAASVRCLRAISA
jgi:hypothetical protein